MPGGFDWLPQHGIVHKTGKPSEIERQEKRGGILPGLRNAKRRHCPRERFIFLILVAQRLTIGRAKHGEIGNRINKQAFGPIP